MMNLKSKNTISVLILLILLIAISACLPVPEAVLETPALAADSLVAETSMPSPLPEVTLPAERPQYNAGELVEYFAQSGDTLPALAAHFNTTESSIREANPILPGEVTTLPMGLPMQIPIYYQPLWGSSYQIVPDAVFVNGPAAVAFDAAAFVNQSDGWLKSYQDFTSGTGLQGGEIVAEVAKNYSIDPRLLLALLEYQTGALSNPVTPDFSRGDTLGFRTPSRTRLFLQLNTVAGELNNAYYGWRQGSFLSFRHAADGRLEYIDPWQNAATASLQYYFAQIFPHDAYRVAISDEGFQKVYIEYFGDPWAGETEHIPGSLNNPEFLLPFEASVPWTYTGGPHTGWGDGEPWAAIDFAPPGVKGCDSSSDWVTAMADGVIARTETGQVVLDLDGDGDERTGWVVFYLHIASDEKVKTGMVVSKGTAIGHPSCEGGTSTGTHVHIARKYNGEWIPASGVLAFNLEGWVVHSSGIAYQGTLVRYSNVVTAREYSSADSQIVSDLR